MFGINKFWIWLAILGGSAYMDHVELTSIIFMIGVVYFIVWVLFGGPQQFELKPGNWVKSVTQNNGFTTVIITDGKDETMHQFFTSKRVSIVGNTISIG